MRPFLPALLAGALAREDTGLDFDGTSFSFLESPWFLLAVFALGVAAYARDRTVRPAATRPGEPRAKVGEARAQTDPFDLVLLAVGVLLGALLFAGSLADEGHASWPGLIAGAACAALGYFAVASLFAGARRRLRGSGGALTLLGVYADLAALAIAGLSILFPPLAFIALAAFLVLIVRSSGEGAQKFEGLRILR